MAGTSITGLTGGLFVGLGVAVAGFFISQTMLNERTGANTARVKGLSERVMPADTGNWTLNYTSWSRDYNDVQGSFDRAKAQRAQVKAVLIEAGFKDAEIRFEPLVKRDHTRENNDGEIIDRFYRVEGQIHIATQEPAKIGPARGPVFALATKGIDVSQYNLHYAFTRLNEVKPDMLREATENARIAANEFARNAGVQVGGIQSASQGGFQIDSVAGDPLQKEVRVVTNISFYLDN